MPSASTIVAFAAAGMLLEATDVREVQVATLTQADATSAGAADLAALLRRLNDPGPAATVWRVDLRYVGIDDRVERRADAAHRRRHRSPAHAARSHGSSRHHPWTRATLRLIEKYPGVVSTNLARHTGQERPDFKLNVRKLKEMGLTESLKVGYQLSPRGEALLRSIG